MKILKKILSSKYYSFRNTVFDQKSPVHTIHTVSEFKGGEINKHTYNIATYRLNWL